MVTRNYSRIAVREPCDTTWLFRANSFTALQPLKLTDRQGETRVTFTSNHATDVDVSSTGSIPRQAASRAGLALATPIHHRHAHL